MTIDPITHTAVSLLPTLLLSQMRSQKYTDLSRGHCDDATLGLQAMVSSSSLPGQDPPPDSLSDLLISALRCQDTRPGVSGDDR